LAGFVFDYGDGLLAVWAEKNGERKDLFQSDFENNSSADYSLG